MPGFGHDFVLTVVPIFIAIDALGTLPIILGLTEDMSSRDRIKLVHLAMLTAAIVGLAFLFAGKYILQLLGIQVGHFAIAGGLVLLGLGLRDLVGGKMMEMPLKEEMIAVVPIGTPLTVGPATLTTLLLLGTEYSLTVVLAAFAVNMAATWLIFLQANRAVAFLGHGGLKAFSKVASLLLAAIAVRMILKGLILAFPRLG